MGEVRLVHQWKGNPADVTQMGMANKGALRDAVRQKNVKHKAYLEEKGYTPGTRHESRWLWLEQQGHEVR